MIDLVALLVWGCLGLEDVGAQVSPTFAVEIAAALIAKTLAAAAFAL
jgi:hypothetical protein